MRNIIILLMFQFILSPCFGQSNEDNKYKGVIDQIIGISKSKQVVAVGENHGRKEESEMRIALIKDPRFVELFDVIVIEFANPRYQDLIDKYVAGDNVTLDELKVVWQNTTQVSGVWDSPVYRDLFVAVREVNESLKPMDQIRVIAADPPVDWSVINNYEDFKPYSNRGSYPIGIIEQEVYDKNLRALVLFGSRHVELWGTGFTSFLAKNHPNTVVTIMASARTDHEISVLRNYVKSDKYSLIPMATHPLGDVKYKDYTEWGKFNGLLKQAADYKLFLGFNKGNVLHAPKEIKEDKVYQAERKRRLRALAS